MGYFERGGVLDDGPPSFRCAKRRQDPRKVSTLSTGHLLYDFLDQAEQVSQGQQDRQAHQKDHEAGEEAGEHPPPLSAEQALD